MLEGKAGAQEPLSVAMFPSVRLIIPAPQVFAPLSAALCLLHTLSWHIDPPECLLAWILHLSATGIFDLSLSVEFLFFSISLLLSIRPESHLNEGRKSY